MVKLKAHEKFHLHRLGLFGVLGLAFLLSQSISHASPLTVYRPEVLAYATSMSRGDLYAAGNESRAANGLAGFSLNSLLNNSAQAKAQHMVDNGYWAHVAPDGTQPWYFFQLAGYAYTAAGENLAYGFNTGYEVNTAWMNSAGHRANILGSFSDVGFGIANGANYQGGQFTVVVAHYGQPQVVAQAPVPPPPASTPAPPPPLSSPAPTPTQPTAPTSSPTPASPDASASTPEAANDTPSNELVTGTEQTPAKDASAGEPVDVANADNTKTETVSALSQIQAGRVPVAIAGSLSLVMVATGGLAMTHRQFMRHLIANGKRYVTHHPLVDITILGMAIGAILSTTIGKLL